MRHFQIGLLLATGALGPWACSTSGSDSGSQAFTANQYVTALRSVALRTALALPAPEEVSELLGSADPKATYEGFVDRYISSEELRPAIQQSFIPTFGMGGDPDDPDQDDPARFAAYVVMQDLPWSELITADYKIDENGLVQKGQGSDAPLDELAGFMTFPSWIETYAGNNFLFNYVREVARVTECYEYPDPDDSLYFWDENNIGEKYLPQADNNCWSCHRTMNVRRSAWYRWDGNGDYRSGSISPTNTFGHDEGVIEPRAGGQFLFSTAPITSPRAYADQIVATDRFKRCACRRFLAWSLGYMGDLAGQSGHLMFDFDASSKPGDKELLDSCTDKFANEFGLRVRTLLRWIFKSGVFVGRIAEVTGES
jgi:hypothetical protein